MAREPRVIAALAVLLVVGATCAFAATRSDFVTPNIPDVQEHEIYLRSSIWEVDPDVLSPVPLPPPPSNPEDAILPGKAGAGPIGGVENLPYVDTIGSPLVGPRGGSFMGGQRGAAQAIKRLIRDLG